jgi:hypothetical protein
MEKDGFPYEKTPTNVKHIAYLKHSQDIVKGISLNSNLYSAQEEEEEEEKEDLEIQDSPIRDRPRNSIYTDDLDRLSKPYSVQRDERVEEPEVPKRRMLRTIEDSPPRNADIFKQNPIQRIDD